MKDLIKNDSLLSNIKRIYEIEYERMNLLGLRLDEISDKIFWSQRVGMRNSFKGASFDDYDLLFVDIDQMQKLIIFYKKQLNELKIKLKAGIHVIENELN